MAWLGTYGYRRKITIDNTKVSAALAGFPIAIILGTSVGLTNVDVSGIFTEISYINRKKIAVTASDGTTQLYVEIENWDVTNTRGLLHVRVASISATVDTDLYLYYDSTQADNTAYVGNALDTPAVAVWDTHFKGVWHLSQDPTGGAGAILDSSGNANHGTAQGSMTGTDLVISPYGGMALDFDGADDVIDCGDGVSLDIIDELTLEATAEADSGLLGQLLVGRDTSDASKRNYSLYGAGPTNSQIWFFVFSSNVFYNAPSANNALNQNWRHYCGVYDKTDLRTYIDGVLSGTPTALTTQIDNDDIQLTIGARNEPANDIRFDGAIGEVRVSATDRSAAWVLATKQTLFDNILTWGAEETGPPASTTQVNLIGNEVIGSGLFGGLIVR